MLYPIELHNHFPGWDCKGKMEESGIANPVLDLLLAVGHRWGNIFIFREGFFTRPVGYSGEAPDARLG